MKDRPIHRGVIISTPAIAPIIDLLGSGPLHNSNALSRTEYQNVKRVYGFVEENPNKKPDPPIKPKESDFKNNPYGYDEAVFRYENALKNYNNWTDPMPMMQAGADRNLFRHMESDGFRMVAWIAKYVEPGQDPLKVLIQMASDAGFDVNPEDVEFAERNYEPSE